MTNYPEGTIGIEIRGIYDGVSAWKLPSGELNIARHQLRNTVDDVDLALMGVV